MMRKLFMFLVVPLATVGVTLIPFLVGPNWSFGWVIFLVPTALVAALVLMNGFRLPDEYMKRWTKAHGLAVTDENRPMIHRYLLRGRRIRTVGALVGYIAYTSWTQFVADDRAGVSWVVATFAGYLLGAAAAEIWAFRPEAGRVRAASLSPRRVADYVPRYAIVGVRATAASIIVLAASWSIIPTRPELADFITKEPQRPELWPILAWAAGAVVLTILVEATARRIVKRPQPVTSAEMIAVDDAIRSTAMHGIMGAGLALLLGILARNVGHWTGLVGPERLDGLFQGVSIVGGLLSIVAWGRLGIDQPWVVHRSKPQETVAA